MAGLGLRKIQRLPSIRSLLAPSTGGGVPAWVPSGSLGYREFTTDRAYKGGLLLANSTSGLTWVRASSGYDLAATTLFGANVPRRTSAGLLVEAAGTNLCARSQEIGSWTQYDTTTSDVGAAPDGSITADLVNENGANQHHEVYSPNLSTIAATTYTTKVKLKKAGRRYVGISPPAVGSGNYPWVAIDFDLGTISANASVVAASVGTLASGFFDVAIKTVAGFNAANSVVSVGSLPSSAPPSTNTASGSPASMPGLNGGAYYLWGAEFKLGDVPFDSYIPTVAGSAARAADAGSDTVPAGSTSCILTFSDATTSTSTGLTPGGTFNIPITPAGKTLVSMDYRA